MELVYPHKFNLPKGIIINWDETPDGMAHISKICEAIKFTGSFKIYMSVPPRGGQWNRRYYEINDYTFVDGYYVDSGKWREYEADIPSYI